jgi:glycosyltransferase involved in cell wall biosynthesis
MPAMMLGSTTHLVLIPSYNPGPIVVDTVRAARANWNPVWVVVDGSTDGTLETLQAMAATDDGLQVYLLPRNQGKGAALLHGLRRALSAGYTHALAMDSDGQHPADRIASFMATSAANPEAVVLGDPIFDASAPSIRLKGRKICNWWVNVETLWQGVHDSLFGFRVYPIAPLVTVMRRQIWMRRYDFDVEAAVRLCWRGHRPINHPAAVKYLRTEQGGVSHFNYWRDNVVLTWAHMRLFAEFLLRLPVLAIRRARGA